MVIGVSKMYDLFSSEIETPYFGQYPSIPHSSGQGYIIHVPQGELIYIPNFIAPKISDRTLDVLLANNIDDWKNINWAEMEDLNNIIWETIQWKQDVLKMYGNEYPLPRLTAWYGDQGKTYTYSGIKSQPQPWNTPLLWLKQQIEMISQTTFNSVLLNWYRNGQDHLAWHDDAEPELGAMPTIGSLNFGESRRFLLRRKADHSDKIEFTLGHGDLLIMSGDLQQYWQHSVPKQTKVNKTRVNLTFRYIHQT